MAEPNDIYCATCAKFTPTRSESKYQAQHEDGDTSPCVWICSVCSAPNASLVVKCVQTISINMQAHVPLSLYDGSALRAVSNLAVDGTVPVLVGKIIICFAQAEFALWDLIPPNHRTPEPKWRVNLQWFNQKVKSGEISAEYKTLVERINALDQTTRSDRNTIAHGYIQSVSEERTTFSKISRVSVPGGTWHELVNDGHIVPLTQTALEQIAQNVEELCDVIRQIARLTMRINIGVEALEELDATQLVNAN